MPSSPGSARCEGGIERERSVEARLERSDWATGKGWAWWEAQVASGEGNGHRPTGLPSPTLLLISFYLPKPANSKERNKRKKRLEKEFGHGDNFPGLTKMCMIPEKKWSDCKN